VTSAPTASTPVETIRFTDVTGAAGLAFHHEAGARGNKWFPETMGAGGGFFDYNGDGWVDILLINGRSWPADTPAVESTMQLYRNQGDGTFQDVTRQSGLAISLYGMGLATADYDNDGDQDLVVTGYRQTLLLRNNGNGAFTDVTALAGIAQGGWSTAAAFVDIDRDGWLDLLIGHYVEWDPAKEVGLDCTYGTPQKDYCAVKYFPGLGLQLYRNQGNGQFMDITESAGVRATEARVLGITIIDYNQDSWPDILVANDLTPTLLFANQGNGTFRDLGVPSGLVLDEGGMAFAGMGVDAAYINNNSQLCVAIGNFTGQPTTLHCQVRSGDSYHLEVFTEQSYRAGIARPTLRMVTFGLFFFDADLDGWQDLFMVNGHVANEERLRNVPYAQPPQLLRNQGNGTFAEVMRTPESGLNFQCIGRGAAYADFDHDGDLDLLLTANQGRVYLLRNDTPRPGHFLRVVTRGTRSNRDGIGAQVRLYTTRRQLTGMVRTGSSYLSQSDTAPTFGLQADEVIDRLEVTWPSGSVETFRGLPLDATFVARESTTPAPVAQPSSTPGAPALSLKHAAVAHYQAGRLDAAASVFKQFLQNQPEDYVAQQYLIELYWRLGQYESARALLRNMSQMLTDANACMQFAFHLEDNQLYDLADQVYHEAVQLDPQAPEALYRLGKNALRARRYNDASTYFRQALQRHPGFVEAQHGLGLAAAERGETALAEQAFREVLRLVPDHAEAHTHLGQIYTRTGRLEAALAAYRRVVQLQPERAQGYHNLGTVLATQGKTAAARAQFHEALRRDPGYFPAHNDLGTLYAEQGEIVLAIEAFRAALQIDPHSVPARYNLALAYGARGEHQTMQQELREILRLAPRNSDAHRQLGVSYLQQGQAAAAIEQFRALSALLPQEAEAQYLLALAYAQIDQAAPMLTALQRTVQLDANHARAHSALASYYWQHQHYDLAWQHGNRAAQLGVPMAPLLDALHRVRQSGR
jgi:tetratricopeptide (TPR) repeat protein